MKYLLSPSEAQKWALNLVKFTAPAIAALFAQLALGVDIKQAIPFALIIFWGLLADYFKKLK